MARKLPRAKRNIIGRRIRELRKARGLYLADLAKQLGTDAGSLSRIETGQREPSLYQIEVLAKQLDVPPSTLLVA